MRSSIIILGFCLFAFLGGLSAQSPDRIIVHLNASDDSGRTMSLTFGMHERATYCIDGTIDSDLVELELAIHPVNGIFDVRFVDHRSGLAACLGAGTFVHIQEMYCGLDTFFLELNPGIAGYPIYFSWDSNSVNLFDYAVIEDLFGGFLLKQDMLTSSTIVVTNPFLTRLMIIAGKVCLNIEEGLSPVPQMPIIGYNYPNPFNGGTKIPFSIPTAGEVTLFIYDLLGREVGRLNEGYKLPGEYLAEWRPDNIPTGIYILRFAFGDITTSRSVIILR